MSETQSGETKILESFDTVDDLLTAYNEIKEDLTVARHSWREEFDKRKAVEKELNGLGKGTSFIDVEKLRTDINTLELQIYHTKESIRHKTESMQEARARDNSELQEKRENLRTLKKQCEDQLKQYKKSQLDALKQKRHEMTINEELREEANMNKTDWKEEVKARTKPDEDRIPHKVEELRQEQEKNIGRFEQKIQEQQDDIDQKYGAIEEEIRKLKDTVEKKKIKLHDLEMARENRLEYNVKVEELRQEQEKNIGRFEQKIQEQQDDIDQKYGAIEEEIRKLKDTVEKKKIKLHDLEMARENRLEYNVKVEEKRIICEHHPDEATAK